MKEYKDFVPTAEWPALVRLNEVEVTALVASAAAPVTPPAGTAAPATDYAAQIALYIKWNQWLVAGGGLMRTAGQILEKTLSPGTALTALNAAIHTFYDAVQGVNNGILDGIKDMQAGKAPAVTFDPMSLPDWPDDSKPDLFTSAWDTIKPVLEQLDTKMAAKYPNSPLIVGIGGLVNAGDKIIATLQHYYPAWGGKT